MIGFSGASFSKTSAAVEYPVFVFFPPFRPSFTKSISPSCLGELILNGDIKQIYPNENRQIYFFKEKNIVQTTLGEECQIFKYENGQVEKKFKDGATQIIFPNGKIKNILPNGYEETYNINGEVEK